MTTCRSTSTSGSKSVLTFALPPISSTLSTIRTMCLPAQLVACKTWGNNQTTRDSYSSPFAWNTSVAIFLERESCILHDSRHSLAVPSATALESTPERVVYLRSGNAEVFLSNLDAVRGEAHLKSSSEFAGLSFLVFKLGPHDRGQVPIHPNRAPRHLARLLVRDTIGMRHGPSERGPV